MIPPRIETRINDAMAIFLFISLMKHNGLAMKRDPKGMFYSDCCAFVLLFFSIPSNTFFDKLWFVRLLRVAMQCV